VAPDADTLRTIEFGSEYWRKWGALATAKAACADLPIRLSIWRMIGSKRIGVLGAGGAKAAAALLVLAALAAVAACANKGGQNAGIEPEQAAAPSPPPPPPPPPQPPPVDLAGRWRLVAASGGACFMTLGDVPGAVEGTIAPEGGCPGNFFTSRKWTFEHGMLIIRDHKGEPLAQLSFTGGHFEGQMTNGGALSLSRPAA
jgi:hypothetical protein